MTIDAVFLDSSALVKVVVDEEDTELASSIVEEADRIFCSQLAYVEVLSALARRRRNRELSDDSFKQAAVVLEHRWASLTTIAVTEPRIRSAAALVSRYPLSGADAVHLASAYSIHASDALVFVTWDRRQARAASDLGFTVQPPID